jgi:hypothetical protein
MSAANAVRTCLAVAVLALLCAAVAAQTPSSRAGAASIDDQLARGSSSACTQAKQDLRAAKRKLRRLRSEDASEQKIKRAKRRVRRAQAEVDRVCEGGERFTLTVEKLGDGEGRVTSDPAGIDCGPECSREFRAGTEITLTADADPGSTFTSWQGGCSGTGECEVTLTEDRRIRAFFHAP